MRVEVLPRTKRRKGGERELRASQGSDLVMDPEFRLGRERSEGRGAGTVKCGWIGGLQDCWVLGSELGSAIFPGLFVP